MPPILPRVIPPTPGIIMSLALVLVPIYSINPYAWQCHASSIPLVYCGLCLAWKHRVFKHLSAHSIRLPSVYDNFRAQGDWQLLPLQLSSSSPVEPIVPACPGTDVLQPLPSTRRGCAVFCFSAMCCVWAATYTLIRAHPGRDRHSKCSGRARS